LIDRRRQSIVLDVRSFRAADCDTGHYLVVAKAGERLAVGKQTKRRFGMEKLNLVKLNEVKCKKQFRAEISNRFVALEKLDAEVDVNKAWDSIRQNVRIASKESLGYCELNQHKP
jgi:hypothetical protein